MTCRLPAFLVLVTSSVLSPIALPSALADNREVRLVPTCVEIDAERDQLTPDQREHARRLLVRALERAELLVVDGGCIDRYTAWHVREEAGVVVRVRGPRGTRRARNVDMDDLADVYRRAIASLLATARPEASEASDPTEQADATAADPDARAADPDATAADPDEAGADTDLIDGTEERDATALVSDGVSPDRLIYGQLSVGTAAFGFGLGYRRQAEHFAFDASFVRASDDLTRLAVLSLEAHCVFSPRNRTTGYVGGGLGWGSEDSFQASGSGPRAEITGGFAFARDGALRWFVQLDLGLPLYQMSQHTGTSTMLVDASPSAAMTIGAGF